MKRRFLVLFISLAALIFASGRKSLPPTHQQIQEKDILQAQNVVVYFLDEYLRMYLTKGFVFTHYLHDDFNSLGSDSSDLIIVATNYRVLHSEARSSQVAVVIEFFQLIMVGFDDCNTKGVVLKCEYVLKKHDNKWLLVEIPDFDLSFLSPAIAYCEKNITQSTRTPMEILGYQRMQKCLETYRNTQ